MAVKLRLMRMGKKKQPTYRIVATDSRSPRDGRFIEIIGTYEPRKDPSGIEVDGAKAVEWLLKGAKASDTVRKLLEHSGVWAEFKQQRPEKPAKAGRKRKDKPGKKVAKKAAKVPAKAAKKAAKKVAAAPVVAREAEDVDAEATTVTGQGATETSANGVEAHAETDESDVQAADATAAVEAVADAAATDEAPEKG